MRLIIENLTMQQAVHLAQWFEGQGEQDCIPWFEEVGVRAPRVEVERGGWLRQEGEDLILRTITS